MTTTSVCPRYRINNTVWVHIKLLSFLNKYTQPTVSWPQFTINFTSGWTFSYEFLVTHVTLLVQYFVYMKQLNSTNGRQKSISFPQVDIPSSSALITLGKSSKSCLFVVRQTIRIHPHPPSSHFMVSSSWFFCCAFDSKNPQFFPYYCCSVKNDRIAV